MSRSCAAKPVAVTGLVVHGMIAALTVVVDEEEDAERGRVSTCLREEKENKQGGMFAMPGYSMSRETGWDEILRDFGGELSERNHWKGRCQASCTAG